MTTAPLLAVSPTAALEARLAAMRAVLPGAVEVEALSDEALVELQRLLAAGQADVQRAAAVVAAAIARRSPHGQGVVGLAQQNGFTTPERFVQSLTGAPLAEARRLVSVGALITATAVLPDDVAGAAGPAGASEASGCASAAVPRWDAAIGAAVTSGVLTLAQAEALRSGFEEVAARLCERSGANRRAGEGSEVCPGCDEAGGAPADGDAGTAAACTPSAALVEAVDRLLERVSRFSLTVEEIRREARLAASLLSAELVAEREALQHQARSLRWFRRPDGMTQYSLLADPESSALIDASLTAALAPRRGGVRFVDPTQRAAAGEIRADERSYEQHAFDVFLGILRTGIDADPAAVFTTASPEVHIVVTETSVRQALDAEAGLRQALAAASTSAPGAAAGLRQALDAAASLGHALAAASPPSLGTASPPALDTEAGLGHALAAASPPALGVASTSDLRAGLGLNPHSGAGIAHIHGRSEPVTARSVLRHLCNGTFRVVTVDAKGRPLDVGRSHRTYQHAQRVALAIRDGGCLMPGCDRPPSQCEAHHLRPWSEGGRTDLDDGVLLCPGHHLNLHNTRSRIERVDPGQPGDPVRYHYVNGATGEVVELRSKSAVQQQLLSGSPDRGAPGTAA